ncbi:MAG: RDD family protein [Candidatus Sumerlaeaceae bacterium]
MEKRMGFEQRIIAAAIDWGILIIGTIVVRVVLKNWIGEVLTAAAVLAYMFTEVMNSASPGKKIMGLTIAAADGSAASQEMLLKRYLIKMSPSLFMLAAAIFNIWLLHGLIQAIGGLLGLGLGFASLYLILQPAKQAVWDQMANTAVFRSAEVVSGSFAQPYSAAESVPAAAAVSEPAPPPPPPPPVGSAVEP